MYLMEVCFKEEIPEVTAVNYHIVALYHQLLECRTNGGHRGDALICLLADCSTQTDQAYKVWYR